MASPHNSNSLFNNIALALTSSAVTAAIIFLTNAHQSSAEEEEEEDEEDDFDAHQAKPTTNKDNPPSHVPYVHQRLSTAQIRRRSKKLLGLCQKRRTLRFFSSDPVPKDVMDTILQTACTAPSGAHKQPWTFVAVSNAALKSKIRDMVEAEETINYQSRMRKTWVKDLESMMDQLHPEAYNDKKDDKISTIQKPYLTEAPWIVCVFKQTHGLDPQTGQRLDHYYVQESVGIACGMLAVAIANANLVTLTSTPMGAEKSIRQLLGRPDNEKLFLLLPVGFPAKNASVPYRNPERKPPSETIVWKQ